MRPMVLRVLSIFLFFVSCAAFGADRPNIIVMLADDVGYGDVGAFIGGGLRGAPTPRLDQMAREGSIFTSFYAQPTCTPTRASLMTGRLPIRAGFQFPLFPGVPMGLHPQEITIGEVLGEAGYQSAVIGKWHLGDMEVHLPHRQGFDEFWGFLYHCDSYLYTEHREWDPNSTIGKRMKIKGIMEGKKGGSATEVEKIDAKRLETLDRDIATRSVDYIKEHANDDKPFFLLSGFAKAHYVNFPHPDFAGKSGSGVFGDAMMELDHHAGMVLDAVKEAGIEENTLVIWFSDNGPSYDTYPDCGYTPFRGAKGEAWEGGSRMPMIAHWPGTVPAGKSNEGIITTMDLFSTFAALGGGTEPDDRPMDGNDQSAFLKGEADSATNTVFYYVGDKLMAIRAGRWKSHFATVSNWPDGPIQEYSAPQIYDILVDPLEKRNLVYKKTYAAVEANMIMREHLTEMKKFPNRVLLPPL
jgi:arylsulfatase A-like enzyme